MSGSPNWDLITIYYNRNYGLIVVFIPNVTELN